MGVLSKASGRITRWMAKVTSHGRTDASILESMQMIRSRATGYSSGKGRVEIGRMDVDMRATGTMGSSTGQECTTTHRGSERMGSGMRASVCDGSLKQREEILTIYLFKRWEFYMTSAALEEVRKSRELIA